MSVTKLTLVAILMASLLLFLPITAGENNFKTAGKSVVQNVPKLFPSGSEIKEILKNKVSSLTYEPLAKLTDKVCEYRFSIRQLEFSLRRVTHNSERCFEVKVKWFVIFSINCFEGSLAITSESTRSLIPADVNKINYVLLTETENISFPITDAPQLWKNPNFNPNNDVAIFITGYKSEINHKNRAIDGVWDAYRYRGGINFIIIDTAKYMRQMYSWSAFHTQALGEGLGHGLYELSAMYPIAKIHLIGWFHILSTKGWEQKIYLLILLQGHSLGAHIAGVAGDTFKNLTNQLLPRITGLDPAYLCFREGELLHRLAREDAAFVDVIHTNSKVLGMEDSIGHADFFPNG